MIITQHNLNERGGAERVLLKIAQRYKATIYTLGYNPSATFSEFKDLDVRVFGRMGKLGGLLPKRVANAVHYGYNFYNMKIGEDYDVINPHMSPSEWIRNRNPRCLWYCHTPPREIYDKSVRGLRKRGIGERALYKGLSNVYARIERSILDRMEAIATNSDNTRERIRSALNRDAEVINPGIEYKNFSSNGDGRYFIYPSRIAEQKRQEYAIEAFSRFMRLGNYGKYKLVLAGSMSERYPEFREYYKRLRSMRVRNVVFMPNPTDRQLIRLYSRATAVLFTAINEDYGIVPLEGMASGKPVISVNEGGPRETIVDGKTGFLVGSPMEMAERMQYIAERPKIAAKMGKEGRCRVEARYSWDEFFSKFDRLARRVSKER